MTVRMALPGVVCTEKMHAREMFDHADVTFVAVADIFDAAAGVISDHYVTRSGAGAFWPCLSVWRYPPGNDDS